MDQLIGLKKFKSKLGKDCFVAVLVVPVTERDMTYGAVGSKVEEQFLDEKQYKALSPSDFGKEVVREFQVSGGRAFLTEFTVCG